MAQVAGKDDCEILGRIVLFLTKSRGLVTSSTVDISKISYTEGNFPHPPFTSREFVQDLF